MNRDEMVLRKFAEHYNIREVRRETEAQGRTLDPLHFRDWNNPGSPVHMETYYVPVVSMKIDEKALTDIANKVWEMDELMHDSECAKLLMEARFIHRLKRGMM